MEPDDEGQARWHQQSRAVEDAQHRAEMGHDRRGVHDEGEAMVVWATNAAEKEGGTVAMDVGVVEGGE